MRPLFLEQEFQPVNYDNLCLLSLLGLLMLVTPYVWSAKEGILKNVHTREFHFGNLATSNDVLYLELWEKRELARPAYLKRLYISITSSWYVCFVDFFSEDFVISGLHRIFLPPHTGSFFSSFLSIRFSGLTSLFLDIISCRFHLYKARELLFFPLLMRQS